MRAEGESRWGVLLCGITVYAVATACGPIIPSTSETGSDAGTTVWQGSLSGTEGANSISESLSGNVNEDASGNLTGTLTASDGSAVTIVSGVVNASGGISGLDISLNSMITTGSGSATCQGNIGGTGSYNGSVLTAALNGSVTCGPSNLALSLQATSS